MELTSRTRLLQIGQNVPETADANDNPDWMRWNNFGIACLDEVQYAEAVSAFGDVVKMRPDYADAYTNIGLTEIEWEKFVSARRAIDKALKLSPNNARALYYKALLERRAGESDAELANLLEVVNQYPQSRDARRELGITYFQRDDDKHAMEQFEALEAIDPDDVAAHYNLSILYRRMGMKEQAKREQALLVTEKFDPASPTSSLTFLREHPENSTESVPWHLHSDLPQKGLSPGNE